MLYLAPIAIEHRNERQPHSAVESKQAFERGIGSCEVGLKRHDAASVNGLGNVIGLVHAALKDLAVDAPLRSEFHDGGAPEYRQHCQVAIVQWLPGDAARRG